MKKLQIFLNGIVSKNPALVLLLGLCFLLAVSTSVISAIAMGIFTLLVLACSNIVISLIRKFIPEQIKLVSYAVIIAGFVTIAEMLLNTLFPAIANHIGIFIPLTVVNSIILTRVDSKADASNSSILHSLLVDIVTGLGFTAAIVAVAFFRELLGSGTLLGFSMFGKSFMPISIMITPPGAFLTLGILLAVINLIVAYRKERANNA